MLPGFDASPLRREFSALFRRAAGRLIQNQALTAFTTAGTSTAYTLTPSPAITAYAAGQSFFVTFNAASGAAPTLSISGVATPPNLVKQNGDGTYSNIAALDIPINHRSRVTLLSATQALVERLPLAQGGPAFSAYASAATSLVQNVATKVGFQTEEFDTAGAYDTATSRFTPLIAGYYCFSAAVLYSTAAAITVFSLYKNGAAAKQLLNSSPSTISAVNGAAVIFLNGTTDYVEVFITQSSATQNNATGATNTYFQGFLARGM